MVLDKSGEVVGVYHHNTDALVPAWQLNRNAFAQAAAEQQFE